ncbi:hypothetical protein [Streptomyces sp. NPDC048659]|uniref:hypothetical protein n=1 Tax=Streptomyces sp. NPDC048659 TaxID=3155489 RepID=UPI003423DC1A
MDVPLSRARELGTEGALPRAGRLPAHAEPAPPTSRTAHARLGAAATLRKDIAP